MAAASSPGWIRARGKLLAALLVTAVGAGVYYGWPLVERWRSNGTERLTNQLWVQRLPRSTQDMVGHVVLIDRDGRRIGAAGPVSRWRLRLELFVWRLEGHTLRTRFPQDDVRASFQVRTWRCQGEAPPPFELCLELARGDRRAHYFSRLDWKIKAGEELPLDLIAFRAAVQAAEGGLGVANASPPDGAPETAEPTALEPEPGQR